MLLLWVAVKARVMADAAAAGASVRLMVVALREGEADTAGVIRLRIWCLAVMATLL